MEEEDQRLSDSTAPSRPTIYYGGHDRFELELEFVQMLSNPLYLQHLATQKLLDNEEFIAYLKYLQYFREPKYLRHLMYPGPTLRALELLQEERFRKDILIPEVMSRMVEEGFRASTSA
ncbi:related to Mediator of RNA polymerase II transcription subunit 31 [Ramularia collo-cygni]|uniref:Mediator of RNA polymerase II transcription subunit 31 n=1 Tax=Ramularia collo-cygni TaxID=112498 RepID=A0A2D3V3S9_9PEZI|nr:related to Mediator of RNA polymerase II transcription subunit 31 [Ramularia collo-cygni]CZT17144.1 related to Mediator of RNA polymerase II transcription subunit 31 [Ramularia collo-cygni]